MWSEQDCDKVGNAKIPIAINRYKRSKVARIERRLRNDFVSLIPSRFLIRKKMLKILTRTPISDTLVCCCNIVMKMLLLSLLLNVLNKKSEISFHHHHHYLKCQMKSQLERWRLLVAYKQAIFIPKRFQDFVYYHRIKLNWNNILIKTTLDLLPT